MDKPVRLASLAMVALVVVAALTTMAMVVESASVRERKPTNHSNNTSVIAVPSDLLVRLVEVTQSLHNLLPRRSVSDGNIEATQETAGLKGASGEERILTLALTQHALLQHRMEELLTQTGRCQAQVEALQEDKEELKREIQATKERMTRKNKHTLEFPAKSDHGCKCKQTDSDAHKRTAMLSTTATIDTTTAITVLTAPPGPPESTTITNGRNSSTGRIVDRVSGGAVTETTSITIIPTTTAATTIATTTTESVVVLGSGVRVKECAGHQLAGARESGVYEIYPSECRPVKVWCDLETAGGGWTVFLNRQETEKTGKRQENFTRDWKDYSLGFGDVNGEYWLGNEILHRLTSREPHILRVDAEDFENSRRFGQWHRFQVEDEKQGYRLLAVMYDTNSTLGDGLLWHSGMQFSTIDRDNDKHKGNSPDLTSPDLTSPDLT
ncbi:tenascin-like [Scylla paramamosain]|uniref:tenascin-like n=1 Tax=Scylla paramamosain TaxID=85552 RepID=UPI003083A939